MKALVHRRYGPPTEVLHLEDVDRPRPGDGEVLLRVRSAGVNWADWALTTGIPYMLRVPYGLRAPRHGIRGTDVAGTVEALGPAAADLTPGDEVFGWCTGAFAEYAVVPADQLVSRPDGVSADQAAGVPMTGMVALQAFRDIAHVRPGDRVLVNGASGGVGTFAVQIAAALGAEVTGVCSTANLDLVRSLGAAHVLDYTREDFTRTGGRYDVILDMADDTPLAARRRALTEHGVLIPNSGAGNRWTASLGRIARARLTSPFLAQTLHPFLSVPRHDDLLALRELIHTGQVTPVVDRTYPLPDAAAAVERVGHGHASGKTIVTV